MSAKSSIQVCIKVRPCEPELPNLWQVKDKRTIHLIDSPADPCVYDYVFDQGSNNQAVFDGMAKHIVEACVKGFNGTIFAYGQTSSGKTYTMMGDHENPGVMVLAAKEIFNQITNNSDRDFLLRVGYIEIYNEKIYDLLNKKNQDLKIYESNGMVNINCQECIITSEEDLLQFLCMGNKERTVGETNMNERSSRSHAIFRIIIESRKTDRSGDDAVAQSILNLVDLAGSERADQTGARGTRLKEGSHINKSLLFLSNVIKSLAENEDNKYVNYRDSKLTRILQASLGGNAFTSIICTIRPTNMEESQSTLNFAMRAKKIRIKPQLNEIVSDATLMKRLEREIKKLKDLLAEEQAKNESQLKVRQLEQRIKTDMLKIITSNTITDHRNKIRRRTWCPSSHPETMPKLEASGIEPNGSNGSALSINHSNLPKPSFYPTTSNSNPKAFNGPKTINIMKSLEVKEELISVVETNFEQALNPVTKSRMRLITLTPTIAQMGEKGEMLEREVVELEAFTKIEQHINSEWEELNDKLAVAQSKIDELQAERFNLLQRSEDLQTDVNALRKSKEEADAKLVEYEEQLQTLKQTVERLEMENRAAVELEFEFNSHKTKSSQRETELLTVLSEKDCTIDNLQKTLNELSNEVLRNSKDDHMRSICPSLETNCELICKKCVDLERLLEDYNNRPTADNGALELDCECEQLRVDIAKARAQLENLQDVYKHMSNEAVEKSELCDRLGRDVISAEEANKELQAKFEDLELTKLRHEQVIKNMQEEYNVVQQKYQALQQDYETLERTAVSTEEQYKKLNAENETLQQKIGTLKQDVEDIQLKLIETAASETHEALVEELKESNNELIENLTRLELMYEELQVEYDDLSNQLMESVQEGDSLRKEYNALQDDLKDSTNDAESLRTKITQLEQEITEKNQLLDATESTINEMREQMTNLQSELLEKSVIVNKVEDYQRQIESLEKQHAEITMVCEELQEKVKETTMSESMSKSTSTLLADDVDLGGEEETDKIQEKLNNLNEEVQELKNEIQKQLALVKQKDELIQETQFEIQMLNERCLSMDVQQVELRSNAQKQQELLDHQANKLANDISRIDQLQESNAILMDRAMKAETALEQRLQLAADVASTKEEYEKRLQSLQLSLDNAKKEADMQEKLSKDLVDSVKLEFLEKIEVSETRYRENMHKYNTEWQERIDKLTAEGEEALVAANTEYSKKIEQIESQFNESQKLVEQLQKELLCSSNEKLQELHEKCEKQMQDYEQLKQSLDSVVQERDSLQSVVDDNEQTIKRLNNELETESKLREIDANKQLQLSLKLEKTIQGNMEANHQFNEQLETCKFKINDLQEDVRKANVHAQDVKKLALEYDQLQTVLSTTTECNEILERRTDELERDLELAQTELCTQKAELECLQNKLEFTLEAKTHLSSMETMLTEELQRLKSEMEEQTEQFKREVMELKNSKAELIHKIESLHKRKLELETSNEELSIQLNNELKTHDRLEKQQEQISILQRDNAQLQSQLQAKKAESERMQQSMQKLESQLESKQTEYETMQQSLHQAEFSLKAKQTEYDILLDALQQAETQLELKQTTSSTVQQIESQLITKQAECVKLQQSLQEGESQLSVAQAENATLQQSLQRIETQLKGKQEAESQLEAKEAECFKMQQTILELQSQVKVNQTACVAAQVFESQIQMQQKALNEAHNELIESQAERNALEQSLKEAESQLDTKQSTCEKLEQTLQRKESELKLKQAEMDELHNSLLATKVELEKKRTDCKNLEQSLQQLEATQVEAHTIINGKNLELTQQVKTLQTELDQLRSLQKANKVNVDADRARLEATISSLLEDKRDLEEKLCTTNEIIKKLEMDLRIKPNSSNNISFESNASSNTSPAPRKSLERDPNLPRKSLSLESEVRRNRRILTHDERRQSYWNDTRHVACMTDPVDANCNCTELDQKLKECQFELFIRESKVTALTIELKNHPLKEENALLKKRLQEEQQKARDELRRLKSKYSELMNKLNAYTAMEAASESTVPATKPTSNVGTQTDSALEAELKKTNDKLNDCMQICRHRYRHITDLEERLKQKENSDTSNISSQTAGEIIALKTKLDIQKKEITTLTNKYEFAKKALKLRKDEIDKLRRGAGTDVAAESSTK